MTGYPLLSSPEERQEMARGAQGAIKGVPAGMGEKVVGAGQYATSFVPSDVPGARATQDKLAEWERTLQTIGTPEGRMIGSLAVDAATLPFAATKLGKASPLFPD